MNASPDTADAVVVGSGINGLVAAAELAQAGWSVILVEANDRIGGLIASDELTVPGYLHDTYSSYHPLFVSGGAYGVLGASLHRHGLEYLNSDQYATASVSERGVVVAYRDPGATVGAFEHPEDQGAYFALFEEFGRTAPQIFGLMGGEITRKSLAKVAYGSFRAHGIDGSLNLVRSAAQSGRAFVRERFTGWEVDQLWTPWLQHSGLGPEAASGAMIIKVLAASLHQFGVPVAKGGQGSFLQAFQALLNELGVTVLTGSRVTGIDVEGGRAVGVRIGDRAIRARKAVVASALPGKLFTELLPAGTVSDDIAQQARTFRPGRAAIHVHVALDGPAPWTDERLRDIAVFHISNGSDSAGLAVAQANAGLIPGDPTIVVGQQHVLDPSRVPEGKALLWLQVFDMPSRPRGDSAGVIPTRGDWDAELVSAVTDRVLDSVERFAPGTRALVRGVHTISPRDFEAANANVLEGDPYSGSSELDQNLLWRPLVGAPNHKTPVPGLWQIGASTHPGGGLAGASGHLAAQQLIGKRR